jgi:hypothetical protein
MIRNKKNIILKMLWITLALLWLVTVLIVIPRKTETGTKDLKSLSIPVDIPRTAIVEVIGTYYNPVSGQCDDSPLITADNSKINLKGLKERDFRWVALSRDLIKRWGGPFDYGDTVYVHHSNSQVRGLWIVHDCMNRRFRKRIDFLVHEKNSFPHKTHHILIASRRFYLKR